MNATTSTLEMPVEKEKAAGAGAVRAKVMVIDDENGFRQMLSYVLAGKGYAVMTAENGEEGVKLAREHPFDVVISDLTMPRMSGLDALVFLKEIDPKMEIIIGTGYATIESAIQSMKRGAFDYITKPYNMDDLCRLVDSALDKRRSSNGHSKAA